MVLILITGSSASGKSTLSSIVSKMEKCVIIPQDSFYSHDFVQFPYTRDMDDSMERPEKINWARLMDLVEKNIDINTNVIVEGHIVLTYEPLVKMADYIFFIQRPKDQCERRFMERGSEGLTSEQNDIKRDYFNNVTWPSHSKYVEEYAKPLAMDDRFFKLPGIKSSANMITSILR